MKQVSLLATLSILLGYPQPASSESGTLMTVKQYEYCVLKTTSNTENWNVAKLYCGCLRDMMNNNRKSGVESMEVCGKPLGIVPDIK